MLEISNLTTGKASLQKSIVSFAFAVERKTKVSPLDISLKQPYGNFPVDSFFILYINLFCYSNKILFGRQSYE